MALLCFSVKASSEQKTSSPAELSGTVRDFLGHPISGAEVSVKDSGWKDVAVASTDAKGLFRLAVDKGRYMALYAVKDYTVNNLEFWAWNLVVDGDMTIDARINGLEVYAINAFLIQVDPSSMQIYFRPMSLERTKKAAGKEKGKMKEILKSRSFVDIAPKLKTDDIEVAINGEPVKILELNRVPERTSEKQEMWAYLMQTDLPKRQEGRIWKICVALRDAETQERGEGCLFWEKPAFSRGL